MDFKANIVPTILLMALFASMSTKAQYSNVFDVTKYGGETEVITQGLMNAWKDACGSTTPSQVLIPQGAYLIDKAVTLSGPCKATVEIRVDGTVKAPADLEGDSWITFKYIDQFLLSGAGTFDGQGEIAWSKNNCGKDKNCPSFPISLRFNSITNGIIQDVTSLNSKNFHVNVLGCKNFTFQNFTVVAPGESINTDGIHIGRSQGINIIDTHISTGDDCISMGDGSQNVTIERVTCGPGHGISVGSLGRYQNEQPVSGIRARNCSISNTTNGVRIKSWPALFGGSATDMHFEGIVMENVQNPIIIDQVYCPYNQCSKKAPSKVMIKDVRFKKIRGTSATPVVAQLSCSSGIPCENVELAEVDLDYIGSKLGSTTFQCSNVKPTPAGC